MKLISIAIPVYNEEDNIPKLHQRLNDVLKQLESKYLFECIILDNRSSDKTITIAKDICFKDNRWRYIRYSRNFGSEASLLAGLDFANGDVVINLFSDLQDPPELIPKLLEKFELGYDVVYGVVRKRNDASILKTIGAHAAYWLIYRITDCSIPPNATDYRLLSKKVYTQLRELRESDRYMRGLIHWIGFNKVGIDYDREPRFLGKSEANIYFCLSFAVNAIVSFSSRPLRWVFIFGITLTFFSVILTLIYIILHFYPIHYFPVPSAGITTAILLILLVLGINSLFLGIIGEYIARIYSQGKKRPIYIVDEIL
jgi:dolichol-phosphate mannosyltransferase